MEIIRKLIRLSSVRFAEWLNFRMKIIFLLQFLETAFGWITRRLMKGGKGNLAVRGFTFVTCFLLNANVDIQAVNRRSVSNDETPWWEISHENATPPPRSYSRHMTSSVKQIKMIKSWTFLRWYRISNDFPRSWCWPQVCPQFRVGKRPKESSTQ